MAKRKATPPKAAEPVKEEHDAEENGDDIEMKDETDNNDGDSKDANPLFVPSINEFRKDLGHYYNSRTLMVGPVKFTELNRGKLSIVTQKAEYCQVKLAKNETGVLQGYLELVFETEDMAVTNKADLEKSVDSTVMVKHMKQVDGKPVDIEDLISESVGVNGKIDNTDSAAEKMLVVTQLPADATAASIKEHIKEARSVLFPLSHVTNERKNYAYVEVPYYKNVKYHNGWNVKFGEHKSKCFSMEKIPRVMDVLKDLRSYKPTLKKNEELDVMTKQELKMLQRHSIHYQRSEWVDDSRKESLKELSELVRNAISNRNKGNTQKNFKSKQSNQNAGNLSQLTSTLSLLSALNNISSFQKKPKFQRNQRW